MSDETPFGEGGEDGGKEEPQPERRRHQFPFSRNETWGIVIAVLTMLGLGPSVIAPWAATSYVKQIVDNEIRLHDHDPAAHLEILKRFPEASLIREKYAQDAETDRAVQSKLDAIQRSMDDLRADMLQRLARLEAAMDLAESRSNGKKNNRKNQP